MGSFLPFSKPEKRNIDNRFWLPLQQPGSVCRPIPRFREILPEGKGCCPWIRPLRRRDEKRCPVVNRLTIIS
jgi:hypothetical protein